MKIDKAVSKLVKKALKNGLVNPLCEICEENEGGINSSVVIEKGKGLWLCWMCEVNALVLTTLQEGFKERIIALIKEKALKEKK